MTKPADDWPKANAFRSGVARGLDETRGRVDRENARITGVAVLTEGEALGHDINIDAEQVAHVVTLGNALQSGLKVRFGHPNMSSNALGTVMGVATNFYLDNSSGVAIARADVQFFEHARNSPNFSKDPVEYLMDIAEESPEKLGTSIVFKRGQDYRRTAADKKVYRNNQDGSPNQSYREAPQKLYVEFEKLRATDFVDQPAANPGGLFSEGNVPLAAEATRFFDEHPELFELLEEGDAQEIVHGFLARYAERGGEGESRPGGPSHTLAPTVFCGTKTNEQLSTELEALSAVKLTLRNDLAGAYLTISKMKGVS